ncbi:hypothetical protein IJ531_04125 [bacterium]|nr:hypothetical protein [bacterium]
MKRRDLIKTSLLTLGASSLALSGCNNSSVSGLNQNKELNVSDIIPKQTATYEFSTPLPFNYKTIDEIIELNSGLKKSRVMSFHNNTPLPLASKFNQWVQVNRGINKSITTYDDFSKFVKYSIDNGFQFTYLMNSPKPFSEDDFKTFEYEFKYVLDLLHKIGCRDIKVANTQVADLINDITKGAFNLSVSTAFEYHNIAQYKYLFNNHGNFNLIDISNDDNQNFDLLKSFRLAFPDKKLELMINEPCIKGCPARISHISELNFCRFNCGKVKENIGSMEFFLKTGSIYPWNLEYYSALGINNFKFCAPQLSEGRANYTDTSYLRNYLRIVEEGINDTDTNTFFNGIYKAGIDIRNNIRLSSIKDILPDIKYFIKHGYNCAKNCMAVCNYCNLCAKRLENLLYG